jgi:hypothetical protein
MAPKGRTPSLLSGTAGASKIVSAINKRKCKRCKAPIPAGSSCVEVGVPATMGHRTYCGDCFAKILAQTRQDLDALDAKLEAAT